MDKALEAFRIMTAVDNTQADWLRYFAAVEEKKVADGDTDPTLPGKAQTLRAQADECEALGAGWTVFGNELEPRGH